MHKRGNINSLMNSVIGGEFAIHLTLDNKLSNKDESILFSSGRAAFACILKSIYKKYEKLNYKILIPDFLCSSITQVLLDFDYPYGFYHVNPDLLPDETDMLTKISCENYIILLISYFGIVDLSSISRKIKTNNEEHIIILDNVQNYFSYDNNVLFDFKFNSFRKWFPVPDGAQVVSNKWELEKFVKENQFAQYKFAGNFLKNFRNFINESVCLELIEKGESILDSDYLCSCSEITRYLLPKIDFEEIKHKRQENGLCLHNLLNEIGIKHLFSYDAIPMFIPIFINNRDNVRKMFFSNNIFTPIHWPYISEKLNGKKNSIYDMELSLICDQRYNYEDMKKQVEILKKCM